MRIKITSVFVDDQENALRFYSETLGFLKKTDVSVGVGEDRWLTVVSPDAPDDTELLLEPDKHRAVGPFKRALVEDGIPAAQFEVYDVTREYERLLASGVRFTQAPVEMGSTTFAVFEDTCGNLIQIVRTK